MLHQNLVPAADGIIWGQGSAPSINNPALNVVWDCCRAQCWWWCKWDYQDKEMRGGSPTHTYICMLEYKIIGKTSPRENTADKTLLWPVMEKLNISHTIHTGKLHLSPCWLHLLKSGICAQPLHCKGSLWHLLPVPVKNGPLPLFSKTVVCCGYKFMPGKNKKRRNRY